MNEMRLNESALRFRDSAEDSYSPVSVKAWLVPARGLSRLYDSARVSEFVRGFEAHGAFHNAALNAYAVSTKAIERIKVGQFAQRVLDSSRGEVIYSRMGTAVSPRGAS